MSLGWSIRRSAQDDGVAAVRIMDGQCDDAYRLEFEEEQSIDSKEERRKCYVLFEVEPVIHIYGRISFLLLTSVGTWE